MKPLLRICSLAVSLVPALLLGGCAATFLVSKDCRTYFFGSDEEGLHRMICTTGDFSAVLADSGLSEELQEMLHRAQCEARSHEEVKALYEALTPEQKRMLRLSFQRHGYDINYKPIGNYRFSLGYTGPEFCPPDTGY